MLKKLIAVNLSLLIFLVSCVGCSSTDVESTVSTESIVSTSNESTIESTEESTAYEKNELLENTYKVPLQNIYVDVPAFNRIEEAYTRIFWGNGKYIAWICMYDYPLTEMDVPCDTTTDLYNLVTAEFLRDVVDHHHANHFNTMDIIDVTVNDIDCGKFEGLVNSGTNPVYDAYTYGYSFAYHDFPCAIIGVVMDEDQPEDDKQLVKEVVDEMIKTVRSER